MKRPIKGGDIKITSSNSNGTSSFITTSHFLAKADVERAPDEERHHDSDVNQIIHASNYAAVTAKWVIKMGTAGVKKLSKPAGERFNEASNPNLFCSVQNKDCEKNHE